MEALQAFFEAILANTFLQNALFAIVLVSIVAGIIGSLLVSSNNVFIGGGVAHCAYGGIGIAVFFEFSILLGASLSAIVVAFLLAFVRKKFQNQVDTFSAILWAFGMSLGVVFLNLSSNANADMESYLFGSLISVDSFSLWLMLFFDCFLIVFVCMYYREILSINYDYEFCKLKGLKVDLLMNVIFAFIAIGIILSMQISGLILVLAMLSIPAYMSSIFVKTLRAQMILSGIFAFLFMFVGLFLAYVYNIFPGAAITFIGTLSIIIVHICRWFMRYKKYKKD